jgi:hypothetical protein
LSDLSGNNRTEGLNFWGGGGQVFSLDQTILAWQKRKRKTVLEKKGYNSKISTTEVEIVS